MNNTRVDVQNIDERSIEMLDRGVAALSLVIEESQRQNLLQYLALMHKWNKAFNLSAVRNPHDMVVKHLLDSLAVLPYLKVETQSCIDVGTGAGLPGIPFSILESNSRWTLLDSNGKKTRFLQEVVNTLSLNNVTVEQQRVEAWSPQEGFDIVIGRAFAPLDRFLKTTAHLLKKTGLLYVMSGKNLHDEDVDNVEREFKVKIEQTPVKVPFLHEERHCIKVEF